MITIEKDTKAEEICINGDPEGLRELAKKLWNVAEEAESKGKHKEKLSTKASSDPRLSDKLQGMSGKYRVVEKLTIRGQV